MPKKTTIPPGSRFGRWTVLERDHTEPSNHGRHWVCQCDCGVRRTVRSGRLFSGESLSCGCLARELIAQRNHVHGRSYSPEHRSWSSMRTRCQNSKVDEFPNYGGRGITICPEWDSFERFYADMGPRPSRQHSIDRIDTNGPYAPWNCRWATTREQTRNTRRNRFLTYDDQTMTVCDWADKFGIGRSTFIDRLDRGWSIERALLTPPRKKRNARQVVHQATTFSDLG